MNTFGEDLDKIEAHLNLALRELQSKHEVVIVSANLQLARRLTGRQFQLTLEVDPKTLARG